MLGGNHRVSDSRMLLYRRALIELDHLGSIGAFLKYCYHIGICFSQLE